MKGIIFNLLEEIVREEYGEQTWDDLLDAADLDGVYTSLGNYPDQQLGSLVAAAAAALSLPPDEVVAWTGRKALPLLAERYPEFFKGHTHTRSFLLTLNDIIHPEVRKLYPGAETPEFEYDTSDPHVLLMRYQSTRSMCAFARGMIGGAAAIFGETLDLDHPRCKQRGDAECLFRLTFSARMNAGSDPALFPDHQGALLASLPGGLPKAA